MANQLIFTKTIKITKLMKFNSKTKFLSTLQIGDILKIEFVAAHTGYNDYSVWCTLTKNNKETHKDYLKKVSQWLCKYSEWIDVTPDEKVNGDVNE